MLGAASGPARQLLSINAFHYRRGGADNVYLDHARLMGERGWATSFFATRHPENLPSADSQYFAEESDFALGGSLSQRLIQSSRIIYSFEARRKLARMLDAVPVDLAHVHNIYHHQSPSILVELKRRGIPVVLTAHDLKLACPAYTMLNSSGICESCKGGRYWNVVRNRCIKGSLPASTVIMLEMMLHRTLDIYARHVDRIVVPSRFYRDKLISWGVDAAKLVYIPNFIRPVHGLKAQTGGRHILYFGRLSKEKGVMTLIRAAANAGVEVQIAGRGPQEAELRAEAEALNAPVRFLGFRTGADLVEIIDAARAIVLPSEWYENSPLSALEALQRGKPLIGARIGGIPELIEENRTGWLFESGNVSALATVLADVSALPETRLSDMAAECRAFISRNHSEDGYFEAMQALYRSLL